MSESHPQRQSKCSICQMRLHPEEVGRGLCINCAEEADQRAGSDESGQGEDYLQEEELRPGMWIFGVLAELFPGTPAPPGLEAEASG